MEQQTVEDPVGKRQKFPAAVGRATVFFFPAQKGGFLLWRSLGGGEGSGRWARRDPRLPPPPPPRVPLSIQKMAKLHLHMIVLFVGQLYPIIISHFGRSRRLSYSTERSIPP